MKPWSVFKSYTFRWWQLALYEIALISLGLGVGAFWPDIIEPFAPILLLLFVIIAPYILFVYLSQATNEQNDNEKHNG